MDHISTEGSGVSARRDRPNSFVPNNTAGPDPTPAQGVKSTLSVNLPGAQILDPGKSEIARCSGELARGSSCRT